jgi:hypothetical protein
MTVHDRQPDKKTSGIPLIQLTLIGIADEH